MESPNSTWLIHQEMLGNLRGVLRKHQQHPLTHPDPSDPWWFLVDPDAPETL